MEIGDVVGTLPESSKARLRRIRGLGLRGNLAKSYSGDWESFIRDLSNADLRRALRLLEDEELRVVTFRAFMDQHEPNNIRGFEFGPDGVSQPLVVPGVFEKLTGWRAPGAVTKQIFRALRDRLKELGIEVLDPNDGHPLTDDEYQHAGLTDRVRLGRMFR